MSPYERRQEILDLLIQEGQVTMQWLADHFDVSIRTIQNDVTELTCTYPIRTIRGRHGGGVSFEPWYNPIRTKLMPEQLALLKKLAEPLSEEERKVMNSIIYQFSR